jgi:hypothetical protein
LFANESEVLAVVKMLVSCFPKAVSAVPRIVAGGAAVHHVSCPVIESICNESPTLMNCFEISIGELAAAS